MRRWNPGSNPKPLKVRGVPPFEETMEGVTERILSTKVKAREYQAWASRRGSFIWMCRGPGGVSGLQGSKALAERVMSWPETTAKEPFGCFSKLGSRSHDPGM